MIKQICWGVPIGLDCQSPNSEDSRLIIVVGLIIFEVTQLI